jgi:hypothetical protein
VQENRRIQSPEVPKPYFVKQFPFVSQVALFLDPNNGSTKTQRILNQSMKYSSNQKHHFVSSELSPRMPDYLLSAAATPLSNDAQRVNSEGDSIELDQLSERDETLEIAHIASQHTRFI